MARRATEQPTSTRTWNMTYVFVIFSIQYVLRVLTNPVVTVSPAMTPTVCPIVGLYLKSDPMDTAASNSEAAPHSEDAMPAI